MKLRYVIFILLLAPSFEMSAAEPIQRPTFQEGAFWHYQVSHKEWVEYDSEAIRSGDYELHYNGRRVRVFRITDGTKVEVRGRAAGELPRMLGTFDRQTRFLDFPMLEDKHWKAEFKGGGRVQRPVHTDNLVSGTKKITIPAGTFEALRIERDDRDRRVNTREYYYVVQCGCIALYSLEITSHPTAWPRSYFGKREITLTKFGSVKELQ